MNLLCLGGLKRSLTLCLSVSIKLVRMLTRVVLVGLSSPIVVECPELNVWHQLNGLLVLLDGLEVVASLL